jgi:hypothetical protein
VDGKIKEREERETRKKKNVRPRQGQGHRKQSEQ